MKQIVPYPLWIGHAGDGKDMSAIYAAGIRALVQLAIEEPVALAPRDLIYFRVPISDGSGNRADDLALAIRSVSELLSRRIPTLVYCGAGMSRSPCIAAAAIAVTFEQSLEASLDLVTGQGPSDVSMSLWQEVCRILACLSADAAR